MKKRTILLGLAAVVVAASVIGGSLAATSAAGQAATSELAAPTLQVKLDQTAAIGDQALNTGSALMPGDIFTDALTVANSGDTPLYVRLTVTKYWTVNGAKDTSLDAHMIAMTAGSGWLQAGGGLAGNSGETQVYYYATPLQPGQSASLPLTFTLSGELGNTYQSAGIALDAAADAVQFVSGENELNADGILASFGVTASLSGDGSIQSVTQ